MNVQAVTDAAVLWRQKVERSESQQARLREYQPMADPWSPLTAMFSPGQAGPDVQAVVELVEPGETWLDIGSGAGRITVHLAAKAGRVLAQDGSPAMAARLAELVAERETENVNVLGAAPWPMAELPEPVDVAFSAHVLYYVPSPVPFVDAMEAHAKRLCVVMLGDVAGSLPPDDAWFATHGEPLAPLPALDDFLDLLKARGIAPDVREVEVGGAGVLGKLDADQALKVLGSRCLVTPGSAKFDRLRAWVHEQSAAGNVPNPMAMRRIALVSWAPPS